MTASITKALDVLGTLADAPDGLALSEVARRQALPAPTVFRILVTLSERGYVQKAPATGRYQLTFKMWEISSAATRRLGVCAAARPLMAALADELNETVMLNIPHGLDRVIIAERVASRRREELDTPPGEPWPMHCSSAGKAILAFTPARLRRDVFQQPFPRYTPATLCDPTRLAAELVQIQRLGYAENRGEFRDGIYGAAVPLRTPRGEIIACLGAAMPPARFTQERIRLQIVPALQRATAAILDTVGRSTSPASSIAVVASRPSHRPGDRTAEMR